MRVARDRRVKTSPRPSYTPDPSPKKKQLFFLFFYYCVQLAYYRSPSATVGGRVHKMLANKKKNADIV